MNRLIDSINSREIPFENESICATILFPLIMTRQTGFPPVDSQRASKSYRVTGAVIASLEYPWLFSLKRERKKRIVREGIMVEKESALE